MPHATAGLRPWFTHRRMLPKWAGFALTAGIVLALPPPPAQAALLVAIGLIIFFPSEYIVHRWVFHHFAGRPAGRIVSRQHIAHHDDPPELDYLFNDPRISVSIGVLYFAIYFAVTRDAGAAAALSFGNFLGLVYYEYVHLTAHRPGVRPWMPWNRFLKRMHLWHHYKNEHYWFGVTTKIFDRVLGSWRQPARVERSQTVRSLVPPDELQAWLEVR